MWGKEGLNAIGFAGPHAVGSVNGAGSGKLVFLGNGASFVRQVDFYLPLNGIDWFHERQFSSKSGYAGTEWQGEGWWSNEMMNLTVSGSEGASNVTVQMDPHLTLTFAYNEGSGTWSCNDAYLYKLTFTSGSDEYTVTRADGFKWVFHDSEITTQPAGKLKRIEDAYGNDWAFTYASGKLTDIVVDVVEGGDYKIVYTYHTSGDNNGLLQDIKSYKSTTTTDANLIGQVDYTYHSSTTDTFGLEDDLMKVVVKHKGTTDGDGTLSIEEKYYYRYYKGTFDAGSNPGTDHQLRYVLFPENADRLNTDLGDPETQTNTNFASYANIAYQYNSTSTVSTTDERLPGGSCGCSGGSSASRTTYSWATNGDSTDADTWKVHGSATREDGATVFFDVNRLFQILTWVIKDTAGTPNKWIWHFDYGTTGPEQSRLTQIHQPSACSAYSESSPYAVTLRTSDGVVYALDYDFATSTYDGYVERVQIKKGTSGTANTLIAYGRTITERPDLPTTITEYEAAAEADGRSTTLAYTFYDGSKFQPKEIDVTLPTVTTAKNGPNSAAVDKYFFDKRTGALRWSQDGEGYVKFFAYDDATGVGDLDVIDVHTTSPASFITSNWDGISHGDLGGAAAIPFTRTESGTGLEIDSSRTIDWLGRVRKSTDAGGTITYHVYKDDEVRTYPAWNTSTFVTLVPYQITKFDKDGRAEDIIQIEANVTPGKNGSNEPDASESAYANGDMASRTLNTYNIAGSLQYSDRYHTMAVSGDGTRYTNFYRTTREYDEMGRLEYVIEDVADETTYDREQVTQYVYDFLGRRTSVVMGVSDNSHDISLTKPTTAMKTTVEYFFDDPDSDATPESGVGDGQLSWARNYYAAASSNDTQYKYDERNRLCLTIPPAAPYTLVKYDNLNRVTASASYSATTNLDPGDDPATTEYANRLDLSVTYFDEMGRVFKTESYDDPDANPPASELASVTYRDRRGLVWATDPANSGISFTQYDGAGRRIQNASGTQFDVAKYTSNVPDYPDNDEGLIQISDFTLDDSGQVTKVVTKELNHDDTDGIGSSGFIASYVYNFYDAAHRMTDTANYGTNNSDGWKNGTDPNPGTVPSRSDTILVTSHAYDYEGRRSTVTDPKAIVTLSVFDKLGRVTSKEEADGTADQRITNYTYNAQNSLTKITADLTTDQVTEYVYTDTINSRWVKQIRYPATDAAGGKTVGQPSTESYDTITFTYNLDGTLATRTDQNGTVLTWSYDSLRRKTEEEVTTLGTYTGGAAAVDSAVRAFTWTYDSEGRVQYVTSHTDTTPDTSTWTDAANQVKYTYNAADKLTKEEQEEDGAVDGSTLAVEYGYGTDYGSSYFNRLNYIEYPDNRKIWYGYDHTSPSSTLQETINGVFNRPGQIARDNSGTIGDLYAEYDFNGLGRFVRRVHDEGSGTFGNDTKNDLWQDTPGTYAGLDRFGRIVDYKFTNFTGTAYDFERRKYGYDRNSNRTHIEHTNFKAASHSATYDNLDRLTAFKTGTLDSSSAVQLSDAAETYGMDLLGNFNNPGVKINTVATTTQAHTTNATNEITAIDYANPAGEANLIKDPFTSSLANIWTQDKGTWSISSGQVNVDTLTGSMGLLLASPDLDIVTTKVLVTFPTGSSTAKAGLAFAHDGTNNFYLAIINRGTGKIELRQVTSGSIGSALTSANVSISDSTQYTLALTRKQRSVEIRLVGQAVCSYDSATDFGTGFSGLYSNTVNVLFDQFLVRDATTRASLVPGFGGLADASIVSGELLVQESSRGGEAIITGFNDDDYMVQADVKMNSGTDADLWVRYTDSNNGYKITLTSGGGISLSSYDRGQGSATFSTGYTPAASVAVKIKVSGNSIQAWVDGTLKINTTDSTHAAGAAALSGDQPKFDNVKVGYDQNADDDIDDVGDWVVRNFTFAGTSVTVSHDHAGNMIDDGTFVYVYDAWNRLVKVRASSDSNVTIQTAEFDATGRRMKKVVTNSGELDATTVYLYDGQKIIETRNGSAAVVQQFIHGTQYIDELVMTRVKDKGEFYVHQDANWNVMATTDMGGKLLERYEYTPYGELTVHQKNQLRRQRRRLGC